MHASRKGHLRRRRFNHLVAELCVATDTHVPRYRLWVALHELGLDPEEPSREQLLAFCGAPLTRFLHRCGLAVSPRVRRRLIRAVRRYDPSVPTPSEQLSWT